MALSTAHTSTKAADPTKFLLLNKCQVKHTVRWDHIITQDTGVVEYDSILWRTMVTQLTYPTS